MVTSIYIGSEFIASTFGDDKFGSVLKSASVLVCWTGRSCTTSLLTLSCYVVEWNISSAITSRVSIIHEAKTVARSSANDGSCFPRARSGAIDGFCLTTPPLLVCASAPLPCPCLWWPAGSVRFPPPPLVITFSPLLRALGCHAELTSAPICSCLLLRF